MKFSGAVLLLCFYNIFIGVQLLYSAVCFCCAAKVNQLHTCIYPLFFRFPSHLGHHGALSRVPCSIQQVLISYLFYTQQCMYVNPSLPHTFHSSLGFPGGASGKESTCQCRRQKRYEFDPWFRKIPWRRAWQSTPVHFTGESHGQRSLVGYSPQGSEESDMTEATQHTPLW